MIRFKKTYQTYNVKDKYKLQEERDICNKYGVASKKQLAKAKNVVASTKKALRLRSLDHPITRSILAKWRSYALFDGVHDDETYYGLLIQKLSVHEVLRLRLQTKVMELGYAANQARQLIVHGHVSVRDDTYNKTVRSNSFLVRRNKHVVVKN